MRNQDGRILHVRGGRAEGHMMGPPGDNLPIALAANGHVLLAGTVNGHINSYGWPQPSRAARLLAERAQRGALTGEPAGVSAGGPVGPWARDYAIGAPAPLEVARLHAAPVTHLLLLRGLLITAAADGTLLISRFNTNDAGGVGDRAPVSSATTSGTHLSSCLVQQVHSQPSRCLPGENLPRGP